MRFIKRHKILTTIVALFLVISISMVGAVNYFLNKITFIQDGDPFATVPTLATQTDDEVDLNGLGKLSKKESKALSDADDEIRKNLDDSKKWYSDQVVNVMLFGYDYGSKNYPYGRSDSMIVISLNKAVQKVKVISLSRTAYSAIPGYQNTRMSHAHGYGGPSLAIQTIEQNYKFRIDNFISCSFDSFKKIIDAFGTVDIELTAAEAKALNKNFGCFPSAGTYNLNGEQALNYARLRSIDNDRTRTGRQRKVIMAIVEKAKHLSVSDCMNLLNSILPLVSTNFTKTEIVYQLANALSYLSWDFEQHLIPAKPYNLVLRDQFEVIIMDWAYEVGYLHDIMYEGVIPQYEEM